MDLPEREKEFPLGAAFLDLLQEVADQASSKADEFIAGAGEKLPASAVHVGNLQSHLYRLSCCYWGCTGSDHVLEWLAGRIVNQAMSAHRLIRAANYDEALMLICGMGEAANLLWLFQEDPSELPAWKKATRAERLSIFSPSQVRKRFEARSGLEPPINRERYQRLCEVGTHPVPGFAPGHFSGTGRPVLGGILQEAGVFVCFTEMAYAAATSAVGLAKLAEVPDWVRGYLRTESVALIKALGAFTILNYEELLASALRAGKPR